MIWCLHGAVGMVDDWALHAERWRASGHEVEAVDLWFYQEDGGLSFSEFAAAFNDRVRESEGEHVLVGYSMGGRLALHALLDDPDLWAGAVLVGAHPGLTDERSRIERMAQDAEWAAQVLTGPWGKFLERWSQQEVLQEMRELSGWADRMALEERRQAVVLSFMHWSLGKQEDMRERLSEIRCPTLWVAGSEDEKFTKLMRECADLAADGSHQVVEGAGHRVPWEKPEELSGLIEDFVSR